MIHLHVETTGVGPDLVMLHGWGMHSGIWDGVRDDLSRHFRLHLVDLPGYGLSPGCAPCTLEKYADYVAERLPQKANVCGWSLGGQLAMRLARREPGRVARLALVATTPCFVRRGGWQWAIEQQVLAGFTADLLRDYFGTLKRFLSLQVRGGAEARAVLALLRRRLFERGRPDARTLQGGLKILLQTDLRKTVNEIAQPVLVLHGEQDVLAHPAAAQWLGDHLPRARVLMLPHCAHAPFLSHPKIFVKALTEFFHGR